MLLLWYPDILFQFINFRLLNVWQALITVIRNCWSLQNFVSNGCWMHSPYTSCWASQMV